MAEDPKDYGSTKNLVVADPSLEEDQGSQEEWELNKVYEELIGLGPAQYIYWTISFLVAYSDYAELTLIAIIIPYLRCEWDLSPAFEASITISIFLVYAVSAMFMGKLSDIYGRKTIMTYTIALLMISAVGAAVAHNKWIFLFWRSITGACIGANFATVVVYSTEFSPHAYRSVGPLISILGSYASMFAVNLIGYFFLNSVGWRWLIIIITLPAIPAYILLLVMPESPRYLCVSGQVDRANSAIRFMAKLNKKEIPENLTVYCHQGQELGSFKQVMSAEHRKPAITLSVMYFCNIFIETGVLVFLPLAFMTSFCGSDGKPPDRGRCDTLSQDDLWKLTISALGSIVGCTAAFIVGIYLGRLKPLRVSGAIQVVVFLSMFICISNAVTFGIVTAIKIINAFVCMMIWLIVPETFPTVIRNTATGIINSSGKCGAVAGTAMVYLLFYVSPRGVISCFVIIAAVSFVSSLVFDKETNDVPLTET